MRKNSKLHRSSRFPHRHRSRSRGRKILDWVLTIVGLAMLLGTVIWVDQENNQQFSGKPRVIDGDSLQLNGREIRLQGIDAPEFEQNCIRQNKDWRCGVASRDALRKLVRSGRVTCSAGSLDQYDRWLGTCHVGDRSINETMVRQGWAVSFGDYKRAEKEAEQKRLGIWQSKFDRPQVWRDLNRGSLAN